MMRMGTSVPPIGPLSRVDLFSLSGHDFIIHCGEAMHKQACAIRENATAVIDRRCKV
jgi:hypothetical protein